MFRNSAADLANNNRLVDCWWRLILDIIHHFYIADHIFNILIFYTTVEMITFFCFVLFDVYWCEICERKTIIIVCCYWTFRALMASCLEMPNAVWKRRRNKLLYMSTIYWMCWCCCCLFIGGKKSAIATGCCGGCSRLLHASQQVGTFWCIQHTWVDRFLSNFWAILFDMLFCVVIIILLRYSFFFYLFHSNLLLLLCTYRIKKTFCSTFDWFQHWLKHLLSSAAVL